MSMDKVSHFIGKYYFLSNFFSSPVMYEGIMYKNNEAAFQSAKTLDMSERKKFSDLDPSSAKKMGRKINLREDWENVKEEVMYQICLDKFTRNNGLRLKLTSTGKAELIEGNTWHDNCWGNCTCEECSSKYGENKLGKILMRIRDELT